MIIDCVSDLHGAHPKLEGGDLLIVAGDLTSHDKFEQMEEFEDWLRHQPYELKVVVAGNHDNHLQKNTYKFKRPDIAYLQDSGTEFRGFKIWGSPWTRYFAGMNPDCCAFTCHHEITMKEKWDMIPLDTDILITHSPPKMILDTTSRKYRVGCQFLREKIENMEKLKLHIFGHIHDGYGSTQYGPILCINASHMDKDYEPVNPPIRIEL